MLLFNWFGYKLVFEFLQQKADFLQEARIERKEYDESSLLEIIIDVGLPYFNDWKDFEPCYGEIEVKGRFYTYVKRKIQNGKLVLKCLPNNEKQNIRDNERHLVKKTHESEDGSGTSPSPIAKIVKSFLADFDHDNEQFGIALFNSTVIRKFDPLNGIPNPGYITRTIQPPDFFDSI